MRELLPPVKMTAQKSSTVLIKDQVLASRCASYDRMLSTAAQPDRSFSQQWLKRLE